ncbi:hypothetical protein XHC_0434 [Xanthomonas hortorum pv. carotae str. M081]|nr:hypothetical protein XHC_0434 [Xanthomonas hortorum pv. carotae str. M081]
MAGTRSETGIIEQLGHDAVFGAIAVLDVPSQLHPKSKSG